MAGRRGRKAPPKGVRLLGSLAVLLGILCLLRLTDPALFAGEESPVPPRTEAPSGSGASGLQVYFFDVGQGDSALLRTPCDDADDGYYDTLIDTGEYAYADGLTDTLRNLGVETLEELVLSHPHTDHMGCGARIVRRFSIGTLYMPRIPDEMTPTTSAYEALLDAAAEKGVPTVAFQDVETFGMAGPSAGGKAEKSYFEVLSPAREDSWESLNNWSGVLRFHYGDVTFLFTGDGEKQVENKLVKALGREGLQSTVLKCGHHGSKTSCTAKFLKAVLPEYAVISCGQDNSYGHPHKETLEKLGLLETELLRTDRDGTILAASDGTSVTWETGLPSVPARQFE